LQRSHQGPSPAVINHQALVDPGLHGLAPVQRATPAPAPTPLPESDTKVVSPELQVESTLPGFSTAVADGEFVSLALPSRFAYYGFKDIYIKPFVARHLSKLQRAHTERSLLHMVEAVSDVMYTSDPAYGGQPMAFYLTLPDFFFALYWLRINGFTKSNYTHTTVCNNQDHIDQVEIHEQLAEFKKAVAAGEMTPERYAELEAQAKAPETLKISELIRNTNIKVRQLETIPDPEVFHFSDTSDMYFRPPTMKDVLEMADHPDMRDKDKRVEFGFLSGLASHIQHREYVLTLDQRLSIVGEASMDQVQLIKDFEEELAHYGVVETVTVTCKGCGASRVSKLTLGAHSFLPPYK